MYSSNSFIHLDVWKTIATRNDQIDTAFEIILYKVTRLLSVSLDPKIYLSLKQISTLRRCCCFSNKRLCNEKCVYTNLRHAHRLLTSLLRSHFTWRRRRTKETYFHSLLLLKALREEFLFNFVVKCNSFWSVLIHFDAICSLQQTDLKKLSKKEHFVTWMYEKLAEERKSNFGMWTSI